MTDALRTVWFHREYSYFTGGHLKHAHYFGHVQDTPRFSAKLTFGSEKLYMRLRRMARPLLGRRRRPAAELQCQREELWPVPPVAQWRPAERDVLFLAGTDWRYLRRAGLEQLPNVRINLIQHVRHAHVGSELYGYLSQRAIRICVCREVADAILATGQTNGPVLTIRNGIDVAADTGISRPLKNRTRTVLIVGYKRRALAKALAARLADAGIPHEILLDLLPRPAFLDALASCDVAVCPASRGRGFLLAGLGSHGARLRRGHVGLHRQPRIRSPPEDLPSAADNVDSLLEATKAAWQMADEERTKVRTEVGKTMAAYSLADERKRFQSVLRNIDRLWQSPALIDLGGTCRRWRRQHLRRVDGQRSGSSGNAVAWRPHCLGRRRDESTRHVAISHPAHRWLACRIVAPICVGGRWHVVTQRRAPAHFALFVPHMKVGGVANVVVNLACGLAERGHRVDLVLGRARGTCLQRVPASVKIIELRYSVWAPSYIARAALRDLWSLASFSTRSSRLLETLPFLPSLVRYLRQERPVAMLAAKTEANLRQFGRPGWLLCRRAWSFPNTPICLPCSPENPVGVDWHR